MIKAFITANDRSWERSRESEEWKTLREHWNSERWNLRQSGQRDAWTALSGYGQFYHPTYHDSGKYSEILRPAGGWHGRWWTEGEATDSAVALWLRQLEIARYGFPDLFEAKIAVFHPDTESWWDICESVPVHSADDAEDRFREALENESALSVCGVLGGGVRAKLFGMAASPVCLERSLCEPAPTQSDLIRLCDEMGGVLSKLQKTVDKWDGSDALLFLERGPVGSLLARQRRSSLLERAMADIATITDSFTPLASRAGRRMKGGRESVVARALALLWTRCGLGKPKFSPQSRFIRACSVVLPWHGIHKADVSQFMRGELGKRRHAGVLIG